MRRVETNMLDHILALISEAAMTRRQVVELCVMILRGVGVRCGLGEWWRGNGGGECEAIFMDKEREE